MSGCFGLIGIDRDGPVVAGLRREIGPHTAIPVPRGTLLIMPRGEFSVHLATFCDTIRENPELRYVLTVGDFNDGDEPYYYDLYCTFAAKALEGEVLLCADVCAWIKETVRLLPTINYHPLVSGVLPGMNTIETPFGTLNTWALWYSDRSSYVLSNAPLFEGMTGPTEVDDYWLTDKGFQYVSRQAATIRAKNTPSRRIVLYNAQNTRSERFLRLMAAFESVGVTLVFVYQDDADHFAAAKGLGDIDLFGRSGDYSFIASGGRDYVSDDPAVALAISQAQDELIATTNPAKGLGEFIRRHYSEMPSTLRAELEETGAAAQQLLREFAAHLEQDQGVPLASFAERWRALCAA